MILKGHSGCILEVKEHNDVMLVYKYSKDTAYNDRLKEQAYKQMNIPIPGFQKCSIVEEGFEDSKYYFAMEYINGISLARYMSSVELNKISELGDLFLKNVTDHKCYDKSAPDIFKSKIRQLKKQLINLDKPFLKRSLVLLEAYQWNYVISSECHGDMTLENIIIGNEKPYLIDFLDSFYDSWMIDIAKILQDTELYWSYRYEKRIEENLYIRLTVLKDFIIDKIINMKNGKMLVETIYHILLLNIIRIVPYSKDEVTDMYLEEKVNYLLEVLDKTYEQRGASL